MVIQVILLLAGLFLLYKGADWLVEGSIILAKKFKVSNLAIGLTVVAFGTSLPEFVVNTFASYRGFSDLVLGNIIGSNNFNLFIIVGVSGIIAPLMVKKNTIRNEIPLSLWGVILVYFLGNSYFSKGEYVLSRPEGTVLLVFFISFLIYVYFQLKRDPEDFEEENTDKRKFIVAAYIIGGLIGLALGGRFVVTSATILAETIGISEKVIGLTIVAAGTSLPELATSVVAVLRKNNDIAVGNIIGSNIFNIFLVLAFSALISPIQYNLSFNDDLLILAIGTILLFIFTQTGKKGSVTRWESAFLLVSYLTYLVIIIAQEL